MADIAKAYVQIIPSAEGIKGSLTNVLSGEATTAGMGAGNAFAGGMSKMLTAAKIGGAAVAATGALVTAATGSMVRGAASVAEYGDNIDKMSQKMGISAEAYQEWDAVMKHSGTTIDALKPSFKTLATQAAKNSDAFQKLGISEQEVATLSQEDLFAKVIAGLQGMEEGTERTYLTSQLLGRGATELGALLNTSAEETDKMRQRVHELGGVMSDDAVKASAKFQDTLQDMTTGFDSIKRNLMSEFLPSITTVMDGLTDIFTGDNTAGLEKMSEGIKAFVTNLTNIAPEALNIAVEIIGALGEGIIQNLPMLTEAVIGVVGKLGDMIVQNLPLLLQTGLQIILTLANSIAESLPSMMPTIVAVMMELVNIIIDNIGPLAEAGIQIIIALAEGIINSLPVLLEKAPEIIEHLVQALIQNLPMLMQAALQIITTLSTDIIANLPQIIQAGIELLLAIVAGIIEALPEIIGASLQAIQSVQQTFAQIDWLEIGVNIIEGIVKGVASGVGKLVDAVKNAANKALDSAKNFLGIHSPSAVFRDDIGKMIDLGMAEGITEYTNPIKSAMNGLTNMTQNAFNAASMITSGGGYNQAEVAPAGFGDITVPVYIGNQKFGQAVVNSQQMNNYMSGGR